jgi:hypothetical protein
VAHLGLPGISISYSGPSCGRLDCLIDQARQRVRFLSSAMSDIHVSADSVMLTIVVTGALTKDEILQTVRSAYSNFGGRFILWDLQDADVRRLTGTDFAEIARVAQALRRGSGERKTAYAVSDATSYLRLCAYTLQAVEAHVPAEYCVFRTLDEARKWLLGR